MNVASYFYRVIRIIRYSFDPEHARVLRGAGNLGASAPNLKPLVFLRIDDDWDTPKIRYSHIYFKTLLQVAS